MAGTATCSLRRDDPARTRPNPRRSGTTRSSEPVRLQPAPPDAGRRGRVLHRSGLQGRHGWPPHGQKVTEQVAEMRSLPAGIDSAAPRPGSADDLALKVRRSAGRPTTKVPIQLKLGASRVTTTTYAWRPSAGRTSSSSTVPRAQGGSHRDRGDRHPLISRPSRRPAGAGGRPASPTRSTSWWPGGIRNGGDIAKCIALGAKGRRDRHPPR
ncbi:hypothetical protein HBB16_15395 [Pseudonocardia sp. MCCB 268]|nr:hypothetical protein [Pseudonocardia cytotoxica]